MIYFIKQILQVLCEVKKSDVRAIKSLKTTNFVIYFIYICNFIIVICSVYVRKRKTL